MEVRFSGCEFLDFETHYGGCKRQAIAIGQGSLCWKRHDPEGALKLVQFCKKRGRMNSPEYCLSEQNKGCSDYHEIQHTIEVSQEELDS